MIVCNIYTKVPAMGISKGLVKEIAHMVLMDLGFSVSEVAFHFVGTKEMRSLNRIHRGLDRPTDVLSFAASEGVVFASDVKDVGDIFLCVPYIKNQAKDVGVSYKEECSRMLIHGLLHALGYDHGNKKDAKTMFGLQERFLTMI